MIDAIIVRAHQHAADATIAGKGYDVDHLCKSIVRSAGQVVISPKRAYDVDLNKERNPIEIDLASGLSSGIWWERIGEHEFVALGAVGVACRVARVALPQAATPEAPDVAGARDRRARRPRLLLRYPFV